MIRVWLLLTFILSGEMLGFTTCKIGKKVIIWNEKRKLIWTDFKGAAPTNSIGNASASVQLKMSYKLTEVLEKFEVDCLFFCLNSWSKDTSAYTLAHEQGHFDIGEIYARKLRKALSQINKELRYPTERKVDSIFNSYTLALANEQIIYDDETDHSRLKKVQSMWDKDIKIRLDSLKMYAGYN